MEDFLHLHAHSSFSLYDGFQKVPNMVARAKELGMPGIALTDHGKVGGFIQLTKACKDHGIKPIYGIEHYLVDDLEDKKSKRFHQTILAKNNTGLENIYKLATIGAKNAAYGFPRIDFDLLRDHSEGLIILSGCIIGKFGKLIENDKVDEARAFAKKCKEVWNDDYYIEVMWTGYEPQKQVIKHGVGIAKDLGLKVVATNDAHYTYEKDGKYQDTKISISINGPLREEKKKKEYSMYLKSKEEMINTLGEKAKYAIFNTMDIFDKCKAEIVFGQAKLPVFDIPKDNEDFNKFKLTQHSDTPENEMFLTYLSEEGLKKRGFWNNSEYRERLYKELETIKFTGFVTYFLILWDYIRYVKSINVRVGAGRGSGAGSLVLYCLEATNIDPIKYELSMDRFLYAEADYKAKKDDFFDDFEEGLGGEIHKNVNLIDDTKNNMHFKEENCSC